MHDVVRHAAEAVEKLEKAVKSPAQLRGPKVPQPSAAKRRRQGVKAARKASRGS